MKFSSPFVFAAGASAQFYGGYPTFRNPYNNFAATRSFGFGYGNNPWQSRWNAPATMTANTAPVMTNTDKADAWISAFDSGDSEAAASFMQPGMTFTVNGAPVGLDLSDPAVVAGLPKHTHSDRYYTAQDDDVVMTLTANFDDKPSNVEFLRLHFNSMGKIDSIVNISPVPPECGEETSAGMTDAAPKKKNKGKQKEDDGARKGGQGGLVFTPSPTVAPAAAACEPVESTCFGDCCEDTTRCEISVTGGFYDFTENDCENGSCAYLSQGDDCPLAACDNMSSMIYLAIPNGDDVTADTCFSWPGAAGMNSQKGGQCNLDAEGNYDGSYTWEQYAGNCDCNPVPTGAVTKTLYSYKCVVDTVKTTGGICGQIIDLGSCVL